MNKPVPFIGDMPYIFISYSHKNKDIVWDTLGDLQKDGFRFWYDDGIFAGVSWDDYIADHINNCGYFVAFISQEYADSDNCVQELRFALETKKPVLLVRLDKKKMTSGLEMRLCTFQSINYYEIDDTEYIERIETAEGITAFQAQQEAKIRRYSYKEKYPRLMRVLKQSYYCEALFLEQELMDHVLFWCIYNMGLIASPSSSRIRDKVRPVLTEILNTVSDDISQYSLSISSPEQKLQLLKALYKWANEKDGKVYGQEYEVLRRQLAGDNYNEYMILFSNTEKWFSGLKHVTSLMLKKNAGVVSDVNAELATNGNIYAKSLNEISKEIGKGNRSRKAFGLK